MTVLVNGIDIGIISTHINDIKNAIINNEPIEEKLHVIIVISNPCQFARRYILAREFIERMKNEKDVLLYIVELAYNDQGFYITDKNNKKHLQLKGYIPLWHKENMINIGVQKLLPKDWKAFAWIDADIDFENPEWAIDTLKILNGSKDVVQLFSHAVDMNANEDAMSIFASFGYQYIKKRVYTRQNILKMWHPGYAWACTRKAYNKMNGIYENSILGSGDHNMALSFIGFGESSLNEKVNEEYIEDVVNYQSKVKNLRLGYIPGVIRHYYHGSKQNRRYQERWDILVNHKYSPIKHITKNDDGLLIPTKECPQKLLDDIFDYFSKRSEDEGLI